MIIMVLVYAGLIWIEVPKLVREKSWRELIVYSVLMSLGIAVSVLEILNIQVWNPIKDSQYLLKDLLHLSYD